MQDNNGEDIKNDDALCRRAECVAGLKPTLDTNGYIVESSKLLWRLAVGSTVCVGEQGTVSSHSHL